MSGGKIELVISLSGKLDRKAEPLFWSICFVVHGIKNY